MLLFEERPSAKEFLFSAVEKDFFNGSTFDEMLKNWVMALLALVCIVQTGGMVVVKVVCPCMRQLLMDKEKNRVIG